MHVQVASDAPILIRAAGAALAVALVYWFHRTRRGGPRKSPKANRGADSAALEVMS